MYILRVKKEKNKEERGQRNSRGFPWQFFLSCAIDKRVNVAFSLKMESRGNYYSAERRNRARSKGEVKTESVSACERERSETSRPRVVAFMSVVSADKTCYRGFGYGRARKRHVEPQVTTNAYELQLQRVPLQANVSWKLEAERGEMPFRLSDHHVNSFKHYKNNFSF